MKLIRASLWNQSIQKTPSVTTTVRVTKNYKWKTWTPDVERSYNAMSPRSRDLNLLQMSKESQSGFLNWTLTLNNLIMNMVQCRVTPHKKKMPQWCPRQWIRRLGYILKKWENETQVCKNVSICHCSKYLVVSQSWSLRNRTHLTRPNAKNRYKYNQSSVHPTISLVQITPTL